MLSFKDFLTTHPTCSVVKNSITAVYVYYHIIWDESIRIRMAELSDNGSPALEACGK